ncbi:uncharacterized protein LOC122870739 [Siniperca chuatsi]|uniref:uncharacterized protein LOC122870739 n=1 Tax=Siniperca chuatsi TaxID=119488 RepID=UPI001CE19B45|nr:uncharacterized protein LOC122870739 [Siniperca chuatsi]XP_044041083.1 uncharacterized protein LOC122870739 [Siniperca chuatsi]XP_044041084.1 uncharacterized protein LOC122870739 [Siniperca chuatsi]
MVRHGTFNFMKETRLYCQNDVDILAEGCMLFRKQYIAETAVDPFSRATIASACMKVFLTNFLPPKTLAIPSPDDYRRQFITFSNAGIQWLEWLSHTRGIPIQHALNKGEKQLGRFFVDGYTEIAGVKYAYEFLGCFYQGCSTCYQAHDTCPLTCRPFGQLQTHCEEKLRELEATHKVKLIMREHTWRMMKKSHQGLKEFLKQYNAPQPLSPHKALYGGFTSAIKLRHTAASNETISYVDMTSLYPYCNTNFPYPLGHPEIIYKDFQEPQSYFGLIRARVYPLRELYFPVLPHRTTGSKLVFTLCRASAELNLQEGPCRHSDDDRALTGVWVTPEFNKALEMGYRIAEITEVWHFDRRSDSIFVDYMHTFLKGKQEALGCPSDAVDQEAEKSTSATIMQTKGFC